MQYVVMIHVAWTTNQDIQEQDTQRDLVINKLLFLTVLVHQIDT